jgi:hypothetical protein
MLVTRRSRYSNITRMWDMDVTQEQLDAYFDGKGLVHEIFPQLTADEREFIMTGITPEEWDELFFDDGNEE